MARQAADGGLEEHGAISLVPDQAGDEVGSSAYIQVFDRVNGPTYSVLGVTLTFPSDELSISLTSQSSAEDAPTCEERISNTTGEGSPTWRPTVIRGQAGCTGTNDAGLTFVEWRESSYWFHVETFASIDAARTLLGSWQLVP
ncbi:MAG: hypothetical protein HKO63_11530 [Acidimicrobiia bacterium]|nr:hypothetical protein [Acidimicrobiia bacterium]